MFLSLVDYLQGIAMQSRKCALCRSDIPQDFIHKPSQFTKTNKEQPSSVSENRLAFVECGKLPGTQFFLLIRTT